MTAKRTYLIQIAIIVLLFVGLLVGTYGANNMISSRASKLTALKAKNEALSQEQLGLASAEKDVKKYASLNSIAEAIVPQDKDQAEATREIVNLAANNKVKLASISFPESTLGNGTTESLSSGTTATVAPTSAAAAANSPANKTSQLTAVPDIPGVYDLQITVTGDPNTPAQYSNFISFLSALEHNRRTAQISAISLQPSTSNPDLLTFSLTLNEYIKP